MICGGCQSTHFLLCAVPLCGRELPNPLDLLSSRNAGGLLEPGWLGAIGLDELPELRLDRLPQSA